jgi:hypothetical protein
MNDRPEGRHDYHPVQAVKRVAALVGAVALTTAGFAPARFVVELAHAQSDEDLLGDLRPPHHERRSTDSCGAVSFIWRVARPPVDSAGPTGCGDYRHSLASCRDARPIRVRDERGMRRSRRSSAPRSTTKDDDLQAFYGSDGTRTRDLRRDRPVGAQPVQPASTRNHPLQRLLHKASGGAFLWSWAPSARPASRFGEAAGCWRAAVLGGCRRLGGAPELEQVVGGGDQLPLGLAGA